MWEVEMKKKLEDCLKGHGVYEIMDLIRASVPGLWTRGKDELLHQLVQRTVLATYETMQIQITELALWSIRSIKDE